MYNLTKNNADSRLAQTQYFYPASMDHRLWLWQKYRNRGTVWTMHMNGSLIDVGEINNMPAVVWADWVSIGDQKLLMLYYGSSRLIDQRMIEDWLQKSIPQATPWPSEPDHRKFDLLCTGFEMRWIDGLIHADPNYQTVLRAQYPNWHRLATGVIKIGECEGNSICVELTKIGYRKRVIVFWWVCSRMSDAEVLGNWIHENRLTKKVGDFRILGLR